MLKPSPLGLEKFDVSTGNYARLLPTFRNAMISYGIPGREIRSGARVVHIAPTRAMTKLVEGQEVRVYALRGDDDSYTLAPPPQRNNFRLI